MNSDFNCRTPQGSRRASIKTEMDNDVANNNQNEDKKTKEVILNSILHNKEIHPYSDKHAKFVENVLSQSDNHAMLVEENNIIKHRKDSKIHLARRDSTGHLHRLDDPEHRVRKLS